MIIDFHTHTFPDRIAANTIDILEQKSSMQASTDGTEAGLIRSMKAAGVDYSVTLPVTTSSKQVDKINSLVMSRHNEAFESGLILFGGMHPDYEGDLKGSMKKLKAAGIRGIKIHPAYQAADFNDIRFIRIIDAASEAGLTVVTHAGWDIGIPDHDYCSVGMILDVLKVITPPKLVLAHMGGWLNWKNIKSDLAGAPLWLDSAFSIGKINHKSGLPQLSVDHNMEVEDFVTLARAHGTDRILFATDCPWADQQTYIAAIKESGLTPDEQKQIFCENACSLIGL